MSRRRSKSKKRPSQASTFSLFDDPEDGDGPDVDAGWSLADLEEGLPDDEYYEDLEIPFSGHNRRRGGYRDMDEFG